NGYRVYNPGLMRFHAADSMSPFGRGGVNSYAYALGDPINLRDPSGHFALISLLIGAIIGAVIGGVVSAAVEGIRAAATGDEFDFKQVFIGAALGFISGGFGAAAIGAKTGVQVGIAVADAVVSGAADFGLTTLADLNNPDGPDYGAAGVGAGVGAAIGLVTFGLGKGIGTVVSKVSRKLVRQNNRIGFLLSPTGGKSKLASSSGGWPEPKIRVLSGENVVLREDFVGSSTRGICYPNISSCISITGVSDSGMVGAHITTGSNVNKILDVMKTGGASGFNDVHVVGALSNYMKSNSSGLRSTSNIKNIISKRLNNKAKIRFQDTSQFGLESHIFAGRSTSGDVTFSYANTAQTVYGFDYPHNMTLSPF
ncbi:RHS repeat-associated core domain-containing protein, partial [Microbulbifer sp. TYP-18]|uniref:RHS repeat-associated core domain-containing protein n=1 Tax=Microbulbifer sp. TYP-18 TaxID=3230024 RepID=UPI0034C686F3